MDVRLNEDQVNSLLTRARGSQALSLEFLLSVHAAPEDECPSADRKNNQAVLIVHLRDPIVTVERFCGELAE